MLLPQQTSQQTLLKTLTFTDQLYSVYSYFEKGCMSENVHATIPKGIVDGFEFTVLQRNLKGWHESHRRMFVNAEGKQQ